MGNADVGDSLACLLREIQDVPMVDNAEPAISAMLLLLVLCRAESIGATPLGSSRSLRHGSLLLAVRRVIAIVIVHFLCERREKRSARD